MGFKKSYKYSKESFCKKLGVLTQQSVPYLFMVNYELTEFIIIPQDEWKESALLFNLRGKKNYNNEPASPSPIPEILASPIPINDYKRGFENVLSHLNYGNSFLLNLTVRTPIEPIDFKETFFANSQPYRFLLDNEFIVFSPEAFIRIENDIIKTFPMKGTIDADISNARELILQNKKESAEHATIVDLMRNDLSMIASKVEVTRYRYIEEIKTRSRNLLQVSSEITGELPDGWQLQFGNILLSLLPAGSICGAPKSKTLKIISESEVIPRNFYTGIMGIFDGSNIDSAVMIRFIEKDKTGTYYRSGGGITNQSTLEEEYNEMINKIYIPR